VPVIALLFASALVPCPVAAQQAVPDDAAAPGSGAEGADRVGGDLQLDFGIEAKTHYRHSEANRFPVNFPFTPDMLPPGQSRGSIATVDPGDHLELSVFTLYADARWGAGVQAHAKVDLYDLYDRNPTSGDRQIDVDEAWIRFGRESLPAVPADGFGGYVKVGKFPKMERQNDRHLESYGVVSTAFNRFEDLGLEVGIDFGFEGGRSLYLKGSLTQGNPLFFRDPNALAGDNGTDVFLRPDPEPTLKSGIPVIYDAEVEGLDTDGDLEVGAAAGVRWEGAAARNAFDVMVYGYRRKLADTVELEGTFYGGDLDFLRGPGNQFPYPALAGDDKEEMGANLWLYLGPLSVFGQYVDQEVASLPRTGYEAEVAWAFDLPLRWAVGGRQLFPFIQPAVRYSMLENDFANPAVTPFPSGAWDWEKIDVGIRLGILPGIDLTAEYAANTFERATGDGTNDETLVTLRWAR
jgi:hypothetical protein